MPIANDYKTSIVIPSQLPEFVRDDINYETFVAFVKAYYEWLELADSSNANNIVVSTSDQGVTLASKNLLSYKDVDTTIDGFIEYYINEFLPYFPKDTLSDKNKVLKLAKQFYETKGTPASYDFLFRLLYNSPAKILETRDLVFRPSDGKWYVPKLLKVKADHQRWLVDEIRSLRVFGETSKSFANIDRIFTNEGKYDVFISDIERLFQSGEQIRVVDTNNQDVYVLNDEVVPAGTPGANTVTGKLVGAISNINIDSRFRGATYNVGDPVVVYGGLNDVNGIGAKASVSEVTRGSIQRIYVTDGGYGYRTGTANTANVTNYANTSILIAPKSGGALAEVSDFDVTPANVANVTLLATNRISLRQLIPISNATYNFPAMPTANANTRLLDALSYTSFTTYPISSVLVNNGGGGFSQLPSVTAVSNYYDQETGSPQDLAQVGILAPMTIANTGANYHVNTRIMFVGGSGYGASANVKTVGLNGEITSVDFVDWEEPAEIYPRGGMGYVREDFVQRTTITPLDVYVSSNVKVNTLTGNFSFREQIYQGANLEYATFTAYVSGYDSTNSFIRIYNTEGTLNANTLLVGNTSGATVNVTSNTIYGTGGEIQVTDILGSGAEFDVATDRVGSVTRISISQFGEDYVTVPQVSLKVQDLCISGIENQTTIEKLYPGAIVFQGQDTVADPTNFFVDNASYLSYVDSIELLQVGDVIANNIYNLRVYNYFSYPRKYNPNDTANTVIQVDTEVQPYPTFVLNTTLDNTSYGYKNGYKQYGDGNAKATARFLNGLIFGEGKYLDSKGQPSSFSVLQSKDYNDYTYELAVQVPIAQYRDMLKTLLHPAGMRVRGKTLLENEKSFTIRSSSTLANSYPLYFFSNTITVSMSTDFSNTATNIIKFYNVTSEQMANVVVPNQRILIERNGMNVYSKVDSVDYANTQIITFVNPFLTYKNVAYGYAESGSNIINITANTSNYGRFINNNEWSSEAQNANNYLIDVIFAGDLLQMNNIIYTVDSVAYANTIDDPTSKTRVYLANNVVANTGNITHPVLLSVNRNVSNSNSVVIYTIN